MTYGILVAFLVALLVIILIAIFVVPGFFEVDDRKPVAMVIAAMGVLFSGILTGVLLLGSMIMNTHLYWICFSMLSTAGFFYLGWTLSPRRLQLSNRQNPN